MNLRQRSLPGIRALAHAQSALEEIELLADRSGWDDGGTQALADLRRCPRLGRLALDLGHSQITAVGLRHLAALSRAPQLRHLRLDVRGNRLTGGVPAFVAALVHADSRLEALWLDLGDAWLDEEDLATIGNLGSLPALRDLGLVLRGNRLGPRAFQSLAWLRFAGGLDSVALDLRDCPLDVDTVSVEGEEAPLLELQVLRVVPYVRLELAGGSVDGPAAVEALCQALLAARVGARLVTATVVTSFARLLWPSAELAADPRLRLLLP